MKLTQRSVTLALMLLLTTLTAALVLIGLTDENRVFFLTELVAFLVTGVLTFTYWRGWWPASYLLLVMITVIAGVAFRDPTMVGYVLAIPPVLAVILGAPIWILISGVAVYLIGAISAGWQGNFGSAPAFVAFLVLIGSIYVGRLFTESLRQEAEENARRAEEERARTQAQAADLAIANQNQDAQLNEQWRLLDLVSTLETPAVRLADGVLFTPIVGNLDSSRAARLTDRLLRDVYEQRARLVVLDIAGVTTVDTAVAKSLLHTAQALRLLGCEVTISGISADVALTLTTLGIGLSQVTTVRSPQEALASWLVRVA